MRTFLEEQDRHFTRLDLTSECLCSSKTPAALHPRPATFTVIFTELLAHVSKSRDNVGQLRQNHSLSRLRTGSD